MNLLRKEQNRKTLLGDDGNPLLWLIYINVTVFIILGFIRIVYVLSDMDLALFDTEIRSVAIFMCTRDCEFQLFEFEGEEFDYW
jgi:hypothetical protein